jgi:ketosteroid isomerase-like protein
MIAAGRPDGAALGEQAMKTGIQAALAVLAIAMPAAAQPASDTAKIKALEARFAAAVEARNVDGIMRGYAPDVFVFDLVPPRQYVGAAAYRKDWQAFLGGYKGPIKFTIGDLDVNVAGPMAYSHSIQTVSGKDASGKELTIVVRVTDVYRKTAGAWRIVHEHVSAPIDLATGRPDLSSAP